MICYPSSSSQGKKKNFILYIKNQNKILSYQQQIKAHYWKDTAKDHEDHQIQMHLWQLLLATEKKKLLYCINKFSL